MSSVTLEIVVRESFGYLATAIIRDGERVIRTLRHYLPSLPDCHAFGIHVAKYHASELVTLPLAYEHSDQPEPAAGDAVAERRTSRAGAAASLV